MVVYGRKKKVSYLRCTQPSPSSHIYIYEYSLPINIYHPGLAPNLAPVIIYTGTLSQQRWFFRDQPLFFFFLFIIIIIIITNIINIINSNTYPNNTTSRSHANMTTTPETSPRRIQCANITVDSEGNMPTHDVSGPLKHCGGCLLVAVT